MTALIPLPDGVTFTTLAMHADERGVFTEIHRDSWSERPQAVQWNVVNSRKNVLRGVHFHRRHHDYIVVIRGLATFCLWDLRQGSPTHGLVARLELSGKQLRGLYLPPGVAHGFFFHTAATHVYSVTEYWNTEDELGFRFDDPDAGMPWPNPQPRLSARDTNLPPLRSVIHLAPRWSPSAEATSHPGRSDEVSCQD